MAQVQTIGQNVTGVLNGKLKNYNNILAPDKWAVLMRSSANWALIKDFMIWQATAERRIVHRDDYSHFEDMNIFEPLVASNIVKGTDANGKTIYTITADANTYKDGECMVIPPDILENPWGVQVIVRSKTVSPANVITYITYPVNPAQDFTQGYKSGDIIYLPVLANVFGEGTGYPESIVSNVVESTNYLQIIKNTFEYTGSRELDKTYWEKDSQGNVIPTFVLLNQLDYESRFIEKMALAWLFGQGVPDLNNPPLDEYGNIQYMTKGIFPTIEDEGLSIPYSIFTGAANGMEAMNLLIKHFQSIHLGTNNFYFGMGGDLQIYLEEAFYNLNINTGADFTQTVTEIFGGSQEMAKIMSMDFKQFSKSNMHFNFSSIDLLNADEVMNANSSDKNYAIKGRQRGIVVPLTNLVDPKSPTRQKLPTLGVVWKEFNGNSRKHKSTQIPFEVTGIDKTTNTQLAHIGAEVMGARNTVAITRG
jgi:hypothetical protein